MSKLRAVYKYSIGSNETSIKLPKFSKVLDIQFQNDRPYLWAEVPVCSSESQEDVEEWARDELFPLEVEIIGTGVKKSDEFFNKYTHFKTLQHGPYVWHFYLNDSQNKFMRFGND